MEIKVKIDAEGLESAIHTLAQVLGNFEYPVNLPEAQKDEEPVGKNKPETKQEAPKEEKAPAKEEKNDEPEQKSNFTMDTITAKTREFIQADKANREKLKSFLSERDVDKVSNLPEKYFDEYMAFVEENMQ
ncbi:hypothetical protein [Salimicrobium halophilum]|uniref:Uncharacterized protein n=1 Tax=Salimicrobium halophilum TaxID=86666 RepID=A0A1G8WFK8_9BACI|nr:hypothetical protein [Salimicrobium halophilum]SDJ76867.1 hypothetical protein SAMN04490247_3167 [Salimicrobium halophilum]